MRSQMELGHMGPSEAGQSLKGKRKGAFTAGERFQETKMEQAGNRRGNSHTEPLLPGVFVFFFPQLGQAQTVCRRLPAEGWKVLYGGILLPLQKFILLIKSKV